MASRLQPLAAVLRVLLVAAIFLTSAAHADPFEPPSSIAAAQEHYTRAKTLFAAKQYADAASEFQAAYDLDPSSKFLLFDLALARRMAGACRAAVTAYQEFLDANPPDKHAANARIGLQKCQDILANAPPPSDEPVKPPPPAPPPVSPPPPPPTEHRAIHEPWYRDRTGDILAGAGIACALGGGALYMLARGAADDTFHASSLTEYHQRHDDALSYQTDAQVLTGLGAALVVAGVIRYAIRPEREIVVAPAPTRGGAALAVEVAF